MKKILSVLTAAAAVLTVPYIQCAAAAPVASAGSVSAKAGETAEVSISLEGCSGFANLNLEIGYNSDAMTLTDVKNKLNEGTFTNAQYYNVYPYNISWNSTSNISYNGVLATMTFTINADAPAGVYDITVDYYKGRQGNFKDGDDVNYDGDYEPLGLTYINGSVTVVGDTAPTPAPHTTVSSGGSGGRTVSRTDNTTDKVYSYTISVPDEITITPNDITVKIGGAAATKHKGFYEKLGAMTGGGDIEFTAAITNIPAGVSVSGTKCEISISYMLEGVSKTDTTEFTLE